MDYKNDIHPISYIKTNAAEILKRVNETRNPIIITQNGEAKAVLIDTQSYQSMIKSIGILKLLSQSENDISLKRIYSQEELFSELDKKIKRKKNYNIK